MVGVSLIMVKYKFTRLEILHSDMQVKMETRVTFPFTYNLKNFSCIFITDTLPFRFYVTSLGIHPVSFELLIDENYCTETYLKEYRALVKYLELKYDPSHTFRPVDFFEALNKRIPATFKERPHYRDIIRINAGKKVEDSEATIFCGWRRSPTGRVSIENLEKTIRAFGDYYGNMSKEKGISSCWTTDENKEDIKKLSEIVSM